MSTSHRASAAFLIELATSLFSVDQPDDGEVVLEQESIAPPSVASGAPVMTPQVSIGCDGVIVDPEQDSDGPSEAVDSRVPSEPADDSSWWNHGIVTGLPEARELGA